MYPSLVHDLAEDKATTAAQKYPGVFSRMFAASCSSQCFAGPSQSSEAAVGKANVSSRIQLKEKKARKVKAASNYLRAKECNTKLCGCIMISCHLPF